MRPTSRPRRASSATPSARGVWAVLLALLAAAGCSQLDLRQASENWPWSEPEPQTPARMVDTWSETVLWQPGKAGVRGFGGRIMFLKENDDKPVLVDGTLTVYAFDDDDPDPDKPPAKKYIFLPEKLPDHHSESKVGHSYSFWLPWDDVGGPERRISLITRFEDREGKVVMSQVAHKTLPGKKEAPLAEEDPYPGTIRRLDRDVSGAVRQVTHEEPVATSAKKSLARMRTTTIPLSPSFARRLAADAESQAESEVAVQPGGQAPEEQATSSEERESPATADPRVGRPAHPNDSLREEPTTGASRSARLGLSRFPARRGAAGGRAYGLARTRLGPTRWPYSLPPTPRVDPTRSTQGTTPADGSAEN